MGNPNKYQKPTPPTTNTATLITSKVHDPEYLITYDSRSEHRAPKTEIVTGIEQWLINNPDKFIVYALKISEK